MGEISELVEDKATCGHFCSAIAVGAKVILADEPISSYGIVHSTCVLNRWMI